MSVGLDLLMVVLAWIKETDEPGTEGVGLEA